MPVDFLLQDALPRAARSGTAADWASGATARQRKQAPDWRAWAVSALVHAALLGATAVLASGTPPAPLPSDTIPLNLVYEPAAAITVPSPPALPSQPEAPALSNDNPPPAPPEAARTEPPLSEPPLPEPASSALSDSPISEAPPPEPAPQPEHGVATPPAPAPLPPPKPRAQPRSLRADPPPITPRSGRAAAPANPAPGGAAAALSPSPALAVPQQAFAPLIPPRPVSGLASNRKPDYPLAARNQNQQGRVLLRVLVSAAGAAEAVEIVSGSGYPLLDQAARAAVQAWRFVPATRGGTPVAAPVDVPVQFRIDE